MAFGTKTAAAQVALTELVDTALAAAEGWQGGFGAPPTMPPPDRTWFVDEDITDWRREPLASGSVRPIEETFVLTVWLYSRQIAASAEAVQAEVFAAADLVDNALGADPTLGGLLMSAIASEPEYGGSFADAEGRSREGTLRIRIACRAHLGG